MYGPSYMNNSTDPVLYIQTLGADSITKEHLDFWKSLLPGENDPSELDRKQAHIAAITQILQEKGII